MVCCSTFTEVLIQLGTQDIVKLCYNSDLLQHRNLQDTVFKYVHKYVRVIHAIVREGLVKIHCSYSVSVSALQ